VIPKPAQYLLRFDDLCPTIAPGRWQQFREVINNFKVSPILAVIPDNRDPKLEVSNPDPAFWEQMRTMERAGAAIALHGYQHVSDSRGKSLLGLHRRSEFAGVDPQIQRSWIHKGMEILHDQGLNPKLWVAPRHGFDLNTLRAVRAEGIDWISDGLARIPFSRGGVNWIPQQLWSPIYKKKGLWTICIHSNSASADAVKRLRAFLTVHAEQFTSFDRVVAEFKPAPLSLSERLYEAITLWRMQARRRRSRRKMRKR
jgi:predicted deacetylase